MKFCDVLEIRNGKNQRKVENPNGKYPIYGSGGIMGWADDYICPANTVIIGRKGSINNPIYADTPFWNVDTAFGLVAKPEILLPKYLYYFCCSFNFETLNTTVTIPSLTKVNLLQIDIDMPSLEEQQKVVETLDCIVEAEKILKDQISHMDDLVKSRFIEMFGDLETNPKGWKKTTFDEVSVKITDGEHATVPRVPDGYVFLNARNVLKSGKIDLTGVTFISEDNHNRIYKRCNPEPGDILLTTTGTIGNVAIVPEMDAFSMDRGITLIKQDRTVMNGTFFAVAMQMESLQMHMKNGIHASAIGHLFMNKVKALPIFVPPLDIQNQFADFVALTDKSKLTIQKSLDNLTELRDSLMQEYFG